MRLPQEAVEANSGEACARAVRDASLGLFFGERAETGRAKPGFGRAGVPSEAQHRLCPHPSGTIKDSDAEELGSSPGREILVYSRAFRTAI
jgi:hypothetical protein